MYTHQEIPMNVYDTSLIGAVKERILINCKNSLSYTGLRHILIFEDKQLDDNQTLKHYNVTKNSTLVVDLDDASKSKAFEHTMTRLAKMEKINHEWSKNTILCKLFTNEVDNDSVIENYLSKLKNNKKVHMKRFIRNFCEISRKFDSDLSINEIIIDCVAISR